ncbi:MAG TPA: hypothetical protein RMH99_32410 [Sandaracinaceae bacterium LLY-WYZ-13_1]|nr:hypothetical protein [Sandaracinaceae bacterium LLY-WYZ-13_1]
MDTRIGRFLQPVRLLVPLLLGGLALAVGGWFLSELLIWSTVSIGSIVLGLFFLLLALASFAFVFPRGCKTCRKLLEPRFGVYPPDAYDALANAVSHPDPQTSAQLAPHRLTGPSGGRRALVRLEVCPGCRTVGTVQVEEQTYRQNQYWHAERHTPEAPVTPENAAALYELCG